MAAMSTNPLDADAQARRRGRLGGEPRGEGPGPEEGNKDQNASPARRAEPAGVPTTFTHRVSGAA